MDKCARTWLLSSSDHCGDGRGSFAENHDPNSNGNGNVGNLAAMKRIMRRKRAMAQDAQREMGLSSLSSSPSTSGDATTTSQRSPPTSSPSSSDRGRGGDDDDCWAMMGNHMEEEKTMDREEEGNFAFSIRHRQR